METISKLERAKKKLTPAEIRTLFADLAEPFVPGLGATRQAMSGNYGQAAVSGLLDFGGPIGKAAGLAALPMMGMIRKVAPQDAALKIAQENAVKMLGLPPGNTPMDRARAMGNDVSVYHGTKQNIQGGMKPAYEDNLVFTTPDQSFSNQWIGKGKFQRRIDSPEELEEAEKQYRKIKEESFDFQKLSQLSGDEFNLVYDKMDSVFKSRLKKEMGIMPEKIHGNVLPLLVNPGKTFNPDVNLSEMEEYFSRNKISPQYQESFKTGNYLPYEDPRVVEYLKDKGYSSMLLRENQDGPQTTLALMNPSSVRSRFAAFDPARRNENDLLAGLAALGIGLPVASGLLNQEQYQ